MGLGQIQRSRLPATAEHDGDGDENDAGSGTDQAAWHKRTLAVHRPLIIVKAESQPPTVFQEQAIA